MIATFGGRTQGMASSMSTLPEPQITAASNAPSLSPTVPAPRRTVPTGDTPLERAGVSAAPSTRRKALKTPVCCYAFFERVFAQCGFLDLTEGMYYGNPDLPFAQAQQNQIDWLLDQVGCGPGSRILDIGCGNGTLVETAARRGAKAVGITISPDQIRRCRRRGLDVRLLDYRDLGDDWNGRFDGIVANGSIEHFVQPQDVLDGRDDQVYREMFAICRRVLKPGSNGRMATTVIHQHEGTPPIRPEDFLKSPFRFRWGSPEFHYALLQRGFGGFYPGPGQLARCAEPDFELTLEVDGTWDYHLTSEYWMTEVRRKLCSWKTGTRMLPRLMAYAMRHPCHAVTMFVCMFMAESWQRQFRGEHPPTRLLRHVWQTRP